MREVLPQVVEVTPDGVALHGDALKMVAEPYRSPVRGDLAVEQPPYGGGCLARQDVDQLGLELRARRGGLRLTPDDAPCGDRVLHEHRVAKQPEQERGLLG